MRQLGSHPLRHLVIAVCLCCGAATSAVAQVSVGVGISVPGLSIGINVPAYPSLARVPGYPVYYAPRLQSNFFFYDGMYWVYQADNWYASSWYNGPWGLVDPVYVPVVLLQVPVRYYRLPPPYFRGWRPDAPPRWGEHWGPSWEQRRGDWGHAVPRPRATPPAPPPTYQRRYSGDRYPQQVERQQELERQHYRYQPRDPVVRQQYEARRPPPQPQARPQPPGHDKGAPVPRQGPPGHDKDQQGGDERRK